jgi:hypothetical protein
VLGRERFHAGRGDGGQGRDYSMRSRFG